MKKFVAGMVCGAALMLTTSVFASGAYEQITAYLDHSIKVEIDGKKVELANTPVNYDGSTYLPVRELAGVVGLSVDWDEASRTAKLSSDSKTAQGSASGSASTSNHSTVLQTKDGLHLHDFNGKSYVAVYDIQNKYNSKGYGFNFDSQRRVYNLVYNPNVGSPVDKDVTISSDIDVTVIDGASYFTKQDYENIVLPLIK